MCAILGLVSRQDTIDRQLFTRLRDLMIHRGPDDAGAVYFASDHIALGHRRLSFLDLGPEGRQPLSNPDGTIWITFNGEIYNFKEIREELVRLGYTFQTHTDTEVIIRGYEAWGIQVTDHLRGMFAFGLLDLNQRKLHLVRDRFGIKPLYYHISANNFLFASELKAITAHPAVDATLDMSAFTDYFVYRYIPSPKTIRKQIAKLPPATRLVYDIDTGSYSCHTYWEIPYGENNSPGDSLIHETGRMLAQSVSLHARSDVPVGSFLSGGYDSSAIVYYLQQAGYSPQAFAIGFSGWEQSEHQYAEAVGKHLGISVSSYMADDNTLDLLSYMPDVYDEPIADISILPTWLVSRHAARQVKAVMSGEGADELFVGYQWQKERYAAIQQRRLWQKLFQSAREQTTQYYATSMSMGRFDRQELTNMLTPDYTRYIAEDTDWFYRSHYRSDLSPVKQIQHLDIKCFMGELVLTKIDRASMAHSLEVRVPFLDHLLYEKVLGYGEQNYYKPEETKHLLYQNIQSALPSSILQRKKQGFVGPDVFYMNRDRYAHWLNQSRLIRDGIIRKDYYLSLLTNRDHWRLWKLTVMEVWYRRWISGS
jgi:asparagine synthase (glutamine-hydrolysing)